MAERSRRFSTTSADESEHCGAKRKIYYLPERATLKPVPKNAVPDDWPCYVLEDTTIYLKDGKTIANLLYAELQSPFVVRGRLVVDGDLKSHLINKKMNGQYIEIPNCQGFSIGSGPITLWALGQSGWLEIRPSEKYQKTYDKMTEAISIYYFLTSLYEEMRHLGRKGSNVTWSIDKILLKYAIQEGTGLVRSETAEKIKGHAEFLLSQMRKGESIVWRSTLFFKWLSTECHGIYAKFLSKANEEVPPPTRIALAILPTPTPTPQLPAPPKSPQNPALKTGLHSRPEYVPSTRSRFLTNSPTASTQTHDSITLPESGAPLPIMLAILHSHFDLKGTCPAERMTLSKLGTILYYKYSVKSFPLGQEIVKAHAKAILSDLGPEWHNAPIYDQLTASANLQVLNRDIRAQALAVTEIKKRKGANLLRKAPAEPALKRRSSRQELETQRSPEPHAAKSILPPLSGRHAGKAARLRLASSPAVKRDALDSSSNDDSSRARKRRRPSPPEMGDDADATPPPPNLAVTWASEAETGGEESGEQDDDDASLLDDKPGLLLSVVVEEQPSLSPAGPNGTWTCERQECVFVVRDAESEAGRELIRAHFNEHEEKVQREALVRREAEQRRLPIDHLLEKLRGLGESAFLDGGMGGIGGVGEIIGGRVVPERIKRGMAV